MKFSGIKAKVLIIDDDADIRSAVRLTLESEHELNLAFTEADNATSGLKALKSTKPDVVILDIHMPGESGFDLMKRLNKDHSIPQSKVIILTADDSFKNLWEAESQGIDAYNFMSKPFRNDDLQAMVLGLLVA